VLTSSNGSSSQSEGNCFIETSNLDGEADFKLRRSIPHTSMLSLGTIAATAGGIAQVHLMRTPSYITKEPLMMHKRARYHPQKEPYSRHAEPHTSVARLNQVCVTAYLLHSPLGPQLEVPLLAPHQLQGTFSIQEPDPNSTDGGGGGGGGGEPLAPHASCGGVVTGGITETQALLQGSFLKNTQVRQKSPVYSVKEACIAPKETN
jgi:hypothetical protein